MGVPLRQQRHRRVRPSPSFVDREISVSDADDGEIQAALRGEREYGPEFRIKELRDKIMKLAKRGMKSG